MKFRPRPPYAERRIYAPRKIIASAVIDVVLHENRAGLRFCDPGHSCVVRLRASIGINVMSAWDVMTATMMRRAVVAKVPTKGPIRSVLCRFSCVGGGLGEVEQIATRKPAASMERPRTIIDTFDMVHVGWVVSEVEMYQLSVYHDCVVIVRTSGTSCAASGGQICAGIIATVHKGICLVHKRLFY